VIGDHQPPNKLVSDLKNELAKTQKLPVLLQQVCVRARVCVCVCVCV
jgi:hypothetical protein